MSALTVEPPGVWRHRPGAERGRPPGSPGSPDEPAPSLFDDVGGEPVLDRRAPSLLDDVGGEPTLDKLVSGAWEGLVAHQRVACPLCGGEMTPEYGVHARPIGGRCGSCGTDLG